MEVPQELITQSMVFLSSPGFEPAVGSPAIYAIVNRVEADEPWGDLEAAAIEWVERQRGLQADAAEYVEILEKKWPSPTVDSVIAGEAAFPPYHGTEWWLILTGVPWARDLDLAVYRAGEYLKYETV